MELVLFITQTGFCSLLLSLNENCETNESFFQLSRKEQL